MLPSRLAERAVTNLKEDIEELRRAASWWTAARTAICCRSHAGGRAALQRVRAGPFFYEVIQRQGTGLRRGPTSARSSRASSRSRGGGEKAHARQRTVQNPYLVD